jgi:hypothetical protein
MVWDLTFCNCSSLVLGEQKGSRCTRSSRASTQAGVITMPNHYNLLRMIHVQQRKPAAAAEVFSFGFGWLFFK